MSENPAEDWCEAIWRSGCISGDVVGANKQRRIKELLVVYSIHTGRLIILSAHRLILGVKRSETLQRAGSFLLRPNLPNPPHYNFPPVFPSSILLLSHRSSCPSVPVSSLHPQRFLPCLSRQPNKSSKNGSSFSCLLQLCVSSFPRTLELCSPMTRTVRAHCSGSRPKGHLKAADSEH